MPNRNIVETLSLASNDKAVVAEAEEYFAELFRGREEARKRDKRTVICPKGLLPHAIHVTVDDTLVPRFYFRPDLVKTGKYNGAVLRSLRAQRGVSKRK